jgi:hypothetical protein
LECIKKTKLKAEGNETSQKLGQLKMQAEDGYNVENK